MQFMQVGLLPLITTCMKTARVKLGCCDGCIRACATQWAAHKVVLLFTSLGLYLSCVARPGIKCSTSMHHRTSNLTCMQVMLVEARQKVHSPLSTANACHQPLQAILAHAFDVMTHICIHCLQVMLVEARQAVYSPVSTANACNKRCLRPAHKAAVDAAWRALGPLVARSSDTSSIAAVNRLLRSTPGKKWLVKKQQELKSHLAKIAASLGVDFKKQVYACSI